MAEKRPRLSQEERDQRLQSAIDAYYETAYGSETDEELAEDRASATDRYLGTNINPAPVGRSQVRDRTTFEVVEWTKPSLLRIFTSGNQVAKFDPVGPGDEEQAEQESDYVNYVIMQKNNWFQICNDWFSDGLILKNGYAYAYWDDSLVTETESYENLTDDGFALIAQDPEIEVVAHTQIPNEEQDKRNQEAYQQAVQQWTQQVTQMQQQLQMQPPQPGQPPPQPPPQPQPPQPTFLHDVDIQRSKKRGQVKICPLAPERCLIDVNTPDHTLDGANYFEFFEWKTIGELRAAKLDVDDDIGDTDDGSLDSSEEEARNLYNENTMREFGTYPDPALRRVKVRHIWLRYDYNGDGINEMQYVIRIGSTLVYRKECEEIPVASISPIPLAHRHIGMSLADTVEDIEDINTNITRAGIDNLNLSNTPRIAVSDRVNLADLLDVRVGGVIRVDGQPPQEFMPVEVPNVFPNAIQALSFFDSRRQNRTGINAYFQGTDANALNKTASGISQLTNSAAQRVEMIARTFASGVSRLFLIVHRLILQHGHANEVYKLRNKWVTVDPAQWRKRSDVNIIVGLGTGNKDSQMAQLVQLFQMQMAAAPMGVVKPENIYETLSEIAKTASFANPERFVNDPLANPPPPPQPPLPLVIEQLKAQVDTQAKQIDAQVQTQLSQQDNQTKLQIQQMGDALTKWKTEYDGQIKIYLEQMKSGDTKELEYTKLNSSERMKAAELERDDDDMAERKALEMLMQQVDALKQSITQVVQKVDGNRVVGVEKIKDPKTGRMVAGRVKRADGTVEDITLQ